MSDNKNKKYINLTISEETSDSHLTDFSDLSQTVHERMAELENDLISDVEDMGSVVSQPATASTSVTSNRIPNDVWKTMTQTQRRNHCKRIKESATKTPQTPLEGSKDDRKRGRDLTTTPSPGNVVKKPKMDYGAAACIKVAVTHADYPHQKVEEAAFQRLLSHLLAKLRNDKPKSGFIRFNGFSTRDGAIVFNCMDEYSRTWLTDSIAQLAQWEGAPIKTCEPKELEGYRKIGAFLPNPVDNVKECLSNIEAQNADPETSRWKILGSKRLDKGLYMVASVPESVVKRIEASNCRLSHGFHIVQVKIFPLKEEATMKMDTDVVTSVCEGTASGVVAAGSPSTVPGEMAPLPDPSLSDAVQSDSRQQRADCKETGEASRERGLAGLSGTARSVGDPKGGTEATQPTLEGKPSSA